jgi:hypothetical protein
MLREVVTDPGEGLGGAFNTGVPFGMIEQGPATVVGGAFSSAPHPASIRTTPASGAAAFLKDGIRITRR